MKKPNLTFYALGVLFAFMLNAGNVVADNSNRTVIFYEGFNEIWEPWGWTFAQEGNALLQWEQSSPGYIGTGAQHTYTNDETQFSNAWMISPAIELEADKDFILSFWEKNQYLPYPAGSLSAVFVSTGQYTPGHADFVQIYESSTPLSSYVETELSLSQFAGNTIHIAFVYQGAYSHNWSVDEVTVTEVEFITTTLAMNTPIGDGSVTPEPGDHVFQFFEGEAPSANISALPALGHTFEGWDIEGLENPELPRRSLLMDQDYEAQATFVPYSEELSLEWHKHGFQFGGGNSSLSNVTNLETLDNFSNSNIEEIEKLVVYGYMERSEGGFVQWIPQNTETFIVRFYDAAQNALPTQLGAPISEQSITGVVYEHGVEVFGSNSRFIYKIELDLNEPVALPSGWVSVQMDNTAYGDDRWFIWSAGTTGNGNNFSFRRNRNDLSFMVLNFDVNIEIWGTTPEVPMPPVCVNPLFPADGDDDIGYPIGTEPAVELEWQPGPDADGYVLYFGETIPEEGIDLGTETSFALQGLSYNTVYEWKVVPYNENGPAENCDVWTFTTIEDPTLQPPFAVDFPQSGNNTIPPDGWDDRKYGKLTAETTLTQGSVGQWIYQSFGHIPDNSRTAKTVLTESANPAVYAWFISPPILLPEQAHQNTLVFDIALTLNNNSTPMQLGPQDKVAVVISEDGGATWTDQHIAWEITGDNGHEVEEGGETFLVSLADYHGIIKLAFYVERENPGSVVDVFVGNISVYETFALELSSNPENGGAVEGQGSYVQDEEVTITATPNTGWTFVEWSTSDGETISDQETYTFDMPAENIHYTAHFQMIPYTLIVEVSPENTGTVAVDPDQDYYFIGDEVTLIATPETDFHFVRWEADGSTIGSDEVLNYTMPAQDMIITAVFQSSLPDIFTLTLIAEPEEGGILSGAGDHEEGTQVTLSATANYGFVFVNWTDPDGNVVSSQASFQITMPSMDITIIAVFQPDETSLLALDSPKINLYPNPTTGVFTVEADVAITRVDILDTSGKVLFSDVQYQQNQVVYHLNLSAGLYFLKIFTAEEVFVRKLKVQN